MHTQRLPIATFTYSEGMLGMGGGGARWSDESYRLLSDEDCRLEHEQLPATNGCATRRSAQVLCLMGLGSAVVFSDPLVCL